MHKFPASCYYIVVAFSVAVAYPPKKGLWQSDVIKCVPCLDQLFADCPFATSLHTKWHWQFMPVVRKKKYGITTGQRAVESQLNFESKSMFLAYSFEARNYVPL